MSDRETLATAFRNHSEKYTYYVIALCVASIAFSVNLTTTRKLDITLIPLGIAIFSWLSSSYFGLRHLQWVGAAYYNNIGLLDVMSGNYPLTGKNPEAIKIGIDVITKELEVKSKKSVFTGKWQNRTFYIGVIFFIIWRVIDMLPDGYALPFQHLLNHP